MTSILTDSEKKFIRDIAGKDEGTEKGKQAVEELKSRNKKMAYTKLEILEDVLKVVKERGNTHGNPLDNHANIANLWTGYLVNKFKDVTIRVDPTDVANMMELLKVARRQEGGFNIDDYTDGAGYAAIAGECASILEERRKEK